MTTSPQPTKTAVVPPLSICVPAEAYFSHGRELDECELTMAVESSESGSPTVVATTSTLDGAVLNVIQLDMKAARRLLVAARTKISHAASVPGLVAMLTWSVGGSSAGVDYDVWVMDFDEIADWLPYALGDEVWNWD